MIARRPSQAFETRTSPASASSSRYSSGDRLTEMRCFEGMAKGASCSDKQHSAALYRTVSGMRQRVNRLPCPTISQSISARPRLDHLSSLCRAENQGSVQWRGSRPGWGVRAGHWCQILMKRVRRAASAMVSVSASGADGATSRSGLSTSRRRPFAPEFASGAVRSGRSCGRVGVDRADTPYSLSLAGLPGSGDCALRVV